MRINSHTHVFNLKSVLSAESLGIIQDRLKRDISPEWLGRAAGSLVGELLGELAAVGNAGGIHVIQQLQSGNVRFPLIAAADEKRIIGPPQCAAAVPFDAAAAVHHHAIGDGEKRRQCSGLATLFGDDGTEVRFHRRW